MTLTMERTDRAFLDFVEGLRTFAVRGIGPKQQELFERKKKEFAGQHGHEPQTVDEVSALMDDAPLVKYREYLQRRAQELIWGGIHAAIKPREQELQQELDRYAAQQQHGKCVLNPNLEIPRWFKSVDFHIQPGAYYGDDMTGYVYDEGAKLYSFGTGRERAINYAVAAALPRADYKRILDLGSGIGKSVIPFAEIYPEAHVSGIDLGPAFVKYAHMIAEEQGAAVDMYQMNAEQLDFPDNSFDLVQAAILYHEVPPKVAENITHEAYRVLEPGGTFVIGDVQPWAQADILTQWVSHWQIKNNGEPYWRTCVAADFTDQLEKVGFKNVWQGWPPNYPEKYRFLTIGTK